MATLREQLIASILRLNASQLTLVAAYLDSLESRDSSPFTPPSRSTPSIQAADVRDESATAETESGSAAIQSGDESPHSRDWPHAPLHRLSKDGTYIVTGGTVHKQHIFRDKHSLDYLESKLLSLARRYGWRLEAWAVFSNHYHFIAHATENCLGLDHMLSHLHQETAMEVNRLDNQLGRQVWFNYWDTKLTFEKSYLARLNYVHQNAVKHRLVAVANQYRWCSAAWFERTARPAQVRTIYSFKTDSVNIRDDYDPVILGVR